MLEGWERDGEVRRPESGGLQSLSSNILPQPGADARPRGPVRGNRTSLNPKADPGVLPQTAGAE